MRQILSSGSVKAFFLNRPELLSTLKEVARDAGAAFPSIEDILLFGSLSRGEESGRGDDDLCIIAAPLPDHPIERLKLFYGFLTERLSIALDLLVLSPKEKEAHEKYLKGALILYTKATPPRDVEPDGAPSMEHDGEREPLS